MDKHEMRREKALKKFLLERGFEVEIEEGWKYGERKVLAYLHKLTGQGDYVGGVVERANREALLEACPEFLRTFCSGYGYEACALLDAEEFMEAWHWPNHRLHSKARDLGECLDACDDYLVVDEERLSALEYELIEEAIDEKLDECWKDASKKISQFFDLDLVPIDKHADEIKGILRGEDGTHCPHFETGCSIAWNAEEDAVSKCEEILKKWRDDVAEEIGSSGELPGADGLQFEAQDALSRIREICSTHTASYEAFEAIKQIASILNHPRAT